MHITFFRQISAEQKHHYAQLILKERPMNKRRLLEITRELSLACAGMSASVSNKIHRRDAIID